MLELATAGTVLVVDDDPAVSQMLNRLLSAEGYAVDVVRDGDAALSRVAGDSPDIILLDLTLPTIDGFEVCRRLKSAASTRLIPIVLITGFDERERRIAGIKAGADDFIGKPFDNEELRVRVRSLVNLKRHTDDLESAESVIMSLALTVEARDGYTKGHCERLAVYAATLGSEIGLPDSHLAALRRGAFLHDVGKIGIPDDILHKPGRLTPGEFAIMRDHTVIGESLCGGMRSLAPARPIVRHHHERLDGSGYPDGLIGNEIPLLAQIVGIVDAYDAMTTMRPYRDALPIDEACHELIEDGRRGRLNAALVECFVGLVDHGTLSECNVAA
ncbi:MAG TPA: HD domain-containing phosphohydrolase [Gemmatimonadaceae bacterium]|jgi:putative two-component system response regulator|nr:HD domain-containing phosphohydrolase [Gemmatimonadaceae bacterium]